MPRDGSIVCDKCGRDGSYRLNGLIEKRGRLMPPQIAEGGGLVQALTLAVRLTAAVQPGSFSIR